MRLNGQFVTMTAGGEMYYYKCPDLLEPGDVIRNGMWGRKIRAVGVTHGAFYREYLFETIRDREFGDRPSRMEVAFAFNDQQYAARWTRGNLAELMYLVRPQDPEAKHCELDMNWFEEIKRWHSFSGAENIVRRYWRGDRSPNPVTEVLFLCPLVVEERLTRLPEDQPLPG